MNELDTDQHSIRSSDPAHAASDAFYEYPEISAEAPQLPDETDAPAGTDGGAPVPGETADGMTPPPVVSPDEPTPRTQKRSVRSVLIVTDDATVIRHSQLRGLLELAGNMKTLGEALGVDPSTISRALAGSATEQLSRDERIRAVRLLIGSEEGS
ncbi:MAG: hypothetical protein ACJ780_28635 [Solirubrobacteraceae bacterium]